MPTSRSPATWPPLCAASTAPAAAHDAVRTAALDAASAADTCPATAFVPTRDADGRAAAPAAAALTATATAARTARAARAARTSQAARASGSTAAITALDATLHALPAAARASRAPWPTVRGRAGSGLRAR